MKVSTVIKYESKNFRDGRPTITTTHDFAPPWAHGGEECANYKGGQKRGLCKGRLRWVLCAREDLGVCARRARLGEIAIFAFLLSKANLA